MMFNMLFLLILLLALIASSSAWNLNIIQMNKKNSMKSIFLALTLFGTTSSTSLVRADTASGTAAFDQVLRVRYSLPQLNADIEKSSEPKLVIQQIKSLLNNYQLRKNILNSLDLVKGSNNYNEAKKHGIESVEMLSTIWEYYEDKVTEDTVKNNIAPSSILQLAYTATSASIKELDQFIDLIPSEIKSVEQLNIQKEFNY